MFIDENLRPFDDQWAFLSSLSRISAAHVSEIVEEAETKGALLGVRMPVDDELADKPWNLPPSRRRAPPVIESALPTTIEATLADQLYVAREGLPPAFVARMVRLAHVELALQDLRNSGRTLPASVRFCGELREGQIEALEALAAHDLGVLAATTAFGKTVVAAALIASRARNTLVLVHRGELLAQWVDRLATFLAIDRTAIGVIGGGKRRLTGVIDIAVIQSLVRRGEADDLVADYGHLIVDECHHVSAASFELAVRRAKAKYVLGLSATVARKDGHHPIIFMQCGPVRYRANARSFAAGSGIAQRAEIKVTEFRLPATLNGATRVMISEVFAALADAVDRRGLDSMKPKRQSLNSTTPPNKEAKLSRPSGRRSIARARESDERTVFLRAPGQQSGLKIKLPRGDSGHGTRWQFLLMPRLCDERARHLQAPRVHAGAAGEERWGRLNPRLARARGWSWRAAIVVGSHVRHIRH